MTPTPLSPPCLRSPPTALRVEVMEPRPRLPDRPTCLRVLELFAGIGGLSLGLEMAGCFQSVAFCEREEHARLILDKHWPGVPQYDDVKILSAPALERDGIGRIDVVAGGWPCQPHSVAGKRQSSNDERDLWSEFARIIGELRPRWVVAENVPGLLSSADPAFSRNHAGGFFGRVLRDLAEMGFDAEWACFPAAAVGAHHVRNRVFVVAWNMDNPQRVGWDAGRHDYPEHDGHFTGAAGQDAGTLAHAPQLLGNGGEYHARNVTSEVPESGNSGGPPDVAYTDSPRLSRGVSERGSEAQHTHAAHGGADVAHSDGTGRQEQHASALAARAGQRTGRSDTPDWAGGGWRQPSPVTFSPVRGMADGVPCRVDRLKRLGNGVVPQQAEVVGRALRDAEAHWRAFGVMPERLIRPEHFRREP